MLKLVNPDFEHKKSAEDFKKEFLDYGETVINGSALLDKMEYSEWLDNTRRNSNSETVREDWTVASTFFAVREEDGKIVGMIDIRHNLNTEFLSKYGGHIGYAVRPTERRKGYATEMLRQALAFAGWIGLTKVMISCYADNTASAKTIEKCGGVLTEVKPYLDGKMMKVYWITI